MHSLVQQIQVDEAQILVWLNRTAIVSSVMPDAPPNSTDYVPTIEPLVLSITARLRRAGKGVRLVIGNGAAKAIDDGVASLIARATQRATCSLRAVMTASTPWRCGSTSGAIIWRCSCVFHISLPRSFVRSWLANSPSS